MSKILTIIIILSLELYSATAKEFLKQQEDGFNSYKTNQEKAFKDYKKAQMSAFKNYKKEISAIWDKPKLSTKKEWLEYSKDKKTRTDVDFKNSTIEVQTVALSAKDAKEKLQIALAKVVTVDTKTVQNSDPLQKILNKIKKPNGMVDAKVKAQPILSTLIFSKKPTKKSVRNYVNQNINLKKIKVKKSSKIKYAKVYSVLIKMPKNAILKRSRIYYTDVKTQASKERLPKSLIFAIIHSESSFNPRARSKIPAFGLMQIVPKTAGIDTYNYLYKKRRLVTSSYLYDSTNNIRMGSAYLHILYYKYLRKIKNPESRLYCTIAAYNTGAGNIAYAFTRTYNVTKAAPIINRLTPNEVYARLLKDLRWDEPKRYLKKVSKRMSAYHKIYD